MKKLIATATILVFALAAGVAWYAHGRLLASRTTLRTLTANREQLDAGIAAVRAKLAAERQRREVLAAQEQRKQTTARPAATPAAGDKPDTALSLDKYPGLRALFRRSVAGKLALRYGAFYRMADLSPEQIRKFEQIMTEVDETKMDFELAARSQGFKPSDPALATLRAQGAAKLNSALVDALGAPGYAQYQQYQRIEPLTGIMGDMTKIAVQHDAPFTGPQADRLMTTLANASSAYQGGGKVEPMTVNWSQVLIDVKPYLSPSQFAIVQQEGDMQQVYQLLKQFYAQRKQGG
ncbi:MAG TPA: hypothetical protein VHE61_08835 [Opitutaceae bacterium]|nr:hypothetical protein [Opitutaceae bacterium]